MLQLSSFERFLWHQGVFGNKLTCFAECKAIRFQCVTSPFFFFIEVILHMSHSRRIITIPCVQGLYWSESRAVSRLLCVLWERRWHSPNLMCLCDLTIYGSQEFRTRWILLAEAGEASTRGAGLGWDLIWRTDWKNTLLSSGASLQDF